MQHWIYENWQAGPHRAVIHLDTCGFCQGELGRSGQGTEPAYGRWIGPLKSMDEAVAHGNGLQTRELKVHRCCGAPAASSASLPVHEPGRSAGQAPISCPEDWRRLIADAVRIDIQLSLDEGGAPLRFAPQTGYRKSRQLPLNRYGEGAFCRCRVPADMHLSGVYFMVIDDELVYVGECADFSQRFNSGYGQISPRNCYQGGQETNSRINKLILEAAGAGQELALYFQESGERKRLEAACLAAYRPPWNRR